MRYTMQYAHGNMVRAGMVTVICVIALLCSNCTNASNEGSTNRAPTIQTITAPEYIAPSETAQVFCSARDDDRDDLTYRWSASCGQIDGTGSSISWIAPGSTGDCTIEVTVSDGNGGEIVKSITITVSESDDRPLTVLSMRCIDCENGIEAVRWSEYRIHCEVSQSNANQLTYTWSTTLGKIEGVGSDAAWFTAGEYGNALITVTVSDDKGNETRGYLAINVHCCK